MSTAKRDTGHPLGLIRAIVHEDGHVAMLAGGAALVPRVEAMQRLLDEFGIPGFRVDWLTPEDATGRYVPGLGCPACKIRLSCGCDINAEVLAGRCPHGTARAIHAAAMRCGYIEATGGPLL